MNVLSVKILKQFLKIAGEELSGEWVLMGGTVLPLLGIDYRSTVDIDIVAVKDEEKKRSQSVKLMEIAEKLKLPVESINQAGEYFLHKIPCYERCLIPLHKGKNATIYRPNLELYIRLKIDRISESDLNDCLEYLNYTKKNKEKISVKIVGYIDRAVLTASSDEKKDRLKILAEHLANITYR